MALCVCDIVFLSVVLVDKNVDVAKDLVLIFPYFWHPMRTILISLEALLMMSISTERLMAVYKPIHFKTYRVSSSGLAHFLVFILPPVILATALNIPKYFEIEFVTRNDVNNGEFRT